MKQIARETGCAKETVAKYILEYGIPLRDGYLPHQRRGQVAYGEKFRNGRVVPHLGELAVIVRLQEMRLEGKSYGALVEWLNEEDVKTKNGRPGWDRPTVFKILQRHSDVGHAAAGADDATSLGEARS